MSRNQKPDYPKFIKKTYSKLKEKQNVDLSNSAKRMIGKSFSMQKMSDPKIETDKFFFEGDIKESNDKKISQKSQKRISN